MMRPIALITLLALGCGAAEPYPGSRAERTSASALEAPEQDRAATEATTAEPGEQSLPQEGVLRRKIIYTANIDLVVEEFDSIPDRVEDLVKQFDGFVASSNVTGSPGSPRSGEWKLRVPVERYEQFLAAVRELGGEVQRVRVDSQDVTAEFYDVEARIRNKKREEERLLLLLDNATGKLEDILAVERELSRVREEIERVEGRLRVLQDVTSLSTVNLNIREIKGYVPEQAPTYRTRARRGFQASIDALVATAQGLSIALIVLSPWLAVFLVFGLVLILIWRVLRRFRRFRPRSPFVEAEAVPEPRSTGSR